jgi:hypothetical protein
MRYQGTHFINNTIRTMLEEFEVSPPEKHIVPSIGEWHNRSLQQNSRERTDKDL